MILNHPLGSQSMFIRNHKNESCVSISATEPRDIEILKELTSTRLLSQIEFHALINMQDNQGNTALMDACKVCVCFFNFLFVKL